MYQANPHSANDKYSALDNVAMPGQNSAKAPLAPMGGMGGMGGPAMGGMGGPAMGGMGGMNSGMGGGAPATGGFQPANF